MKKFLLTCGIFGVFLLPAFVFPIDTSVNSTFPVNAQAVCHKDASGKCNPVVLDANGRLPVAQATGQTTMSASVPVTLASDQTAVLAARAAPAGATAFTCNQAGITATTICQAAQGAGVKVYVTDVWLSNGSTTASTISIIYADAGACTGNPAQITPPTALASNAGAGSFTQYSFQIPVAAPANKAVCCKTTGSTAFSCMLSGYYGP